MNSTRMALRAYEEAEALETSLKERDPVFYSQIEPGEMFWLCFFRILHGREQK